MTVSAKMFGNAVLKAFNKEVDWDTDAIRVMLLTSAVAPDQDTWIYKSHIVANGGVEVVGTAYVARGALLGTKTIGYTADNVIKLSGAAVTWAVSTITARYAIIYDDTTVDATSVLLGFVDFGADQVSSAGNFTITWNTDGIFTITAA